METQIVKTQADQRNFYIDSTLNARRISYQNLWGNLLADQERYILKELENAHQEAIGLNNIYNMRNNVAGTMASSQPVSLPSYSNLATSMANSTASVSMIAGMSQSGRDASSAQAEARKIEEAAAQARRDVLSASYRRDTQLVTEEMNNRIAMESAIRQHGLESAQVVMLTASQREVQIRRQMAEQIVAVERQLSEGMITTQAQATQLTQAIIRRTEAELNMNRATSDAVQVGNRHSDTLNTIYTRVLSITSAMIAYQAIGIIVGIPKELLDTNIQFEKLKILLEGVTGSAQNANIEFKRLTQLDLKTPFDIKGLTETFVMLKNYGLEPTEMVMKSLTDAVSKLGGGTTELIGIGRQLGQAWAKDKLQAVDMRPMIENGLPVISLLSEALHKSAAEILAMSQAGQIGRREMLLLFEQMEKDSPNAAARNMNTLYGALSNVTTAWQQFQNALLEDKSEGIIKKIFQGWSAQLLEWKDSISNVINWDRELIKNYTELANVRDRMEKAKSMPLHNLIPGFSDSELKSQEKALLAQQDTIINGMREEEKERIKLKESGENKLAKDAESLELSKKQLDAATKLLEVQSKIDASSVATQNSNIDSKIKDIKRLTDTTVANLETEKSTLGLSLSQGKITADEKFKIEKDLNTKIMEARVAMLDKVEQLERSKLTAKVVDVDRAWAAILKIETNKDVGQVNPVSMAMGPGQALPSTLTGIKNGKDVGVGYGVKPFQPAIDENLMGMLDDYNKVKEFATKHDQELKDWSEKYFRALVVGTGSIDAALKIYGENTDAYRANFKKAYDDITDGKIKQNKLDDASKDTLEQKNQVIAKYASENNKINLEAATRLKALTEAQSDFQLKEQQRLTTSRVSDLQLELKQNEDLFSRKMISSSTYYNNEIDLIHKTRDTKLQALDQEINIQKTKVTSTTDDIKRIDFQNTLNDLLDRRKKLIGDTKLAEQEAYTTSLKGNDEYNKALAKTNYEYEYLLGNYQKAARMKFDATEKPNITQYTNVVNDPNSTEVQKREAKNAIDKENSLRAYAGLSQEINAINTKRNELNYVYDQQLSVIKSKESNGTIGIFTALVEEDKLRKVKLENLQLDLKAAEAVSKRAQDEAKLYGTEEKVNLSRRADSQLAKLKSNIEVLKEEGTALGNHFQKSIGDAFENSLTGMIMKTQTAQQAFTSFATSVVTDIAKIIASEIRSKIIGQLFSSALGALGGTELGASALVSMGMGGSGTNAVMSAGKNVSGSAWPVANADGGIYSGAGISHYSGSVVNKPTLFPFANGTGLMGEAGPEAILPLKQTTSGALGVQAALTVNTPIPTQDNTKNTSGGDTYNVTITVQAAKGDSPSDMGNKAGEAFIRTIAKQEINSASRPGNVLNRTTKFGA